MRNNFSIKRIVLTSGIVVVILALGFSAIYFTPLRFRFVDPYNYDECEQAGGRIIERTYTRLATTCVYKGQSYNYDLPPMSPD